MTRNDVRDALLAADRDEMPHLDRIRRQVLRQELGPSRRFYWGAIAATWFLVAGLWAFTPGVPTPDPRAAELARAAGLMAEEMASLSSPIEPSRPFRIPWM